MKRVSVFLLSLMTVVGILAGPAMGGQDITLTVVYDNYTLAEGVWNDWGFSCLIEGTDRTILFDTGARGDLRAHIALYTPDECLRSVANSYPCHPGCQLRTDHSVRDGYRDQTGVVVVFEGTFTGRTV